MIVSVYNLPLKFGTHIQQIIDLTGQRSLPGYYDDQQAYMALMNNGIAVGRELKLALGIPGFRFTASGLRVLCCSSDVTQWNPGLCDGLGLQLAT